MVARSFPALGFDPAPGDLALTAEAAASVRMVVDVLGEVERILAGERGGRWLGQAAEAFHSKVADELTPRVREALSSFSEANDALRQWVDRLGSFQQRAQRLEQRAQEALDALHAAIASLDALPHPGRVAEAQMADARQNMHLAQNRVDDAQSVLAGIRREAESLHEEVEAAAADTARRLHGSASGAPDEPGLLDQIGSALGDLGSWFADVGSWLADRFDWIMENVVPIIEAALPYIIMAVAVASLFTTGGLATPLLILAGVGLGIDTAQALRGEGSWGEVAVGAASLLAGAGLGRLASRFMAMRGNAFRISINSPGTALPGGGTVAGTATASVRFYPNMYNVGTMGWATTKFTDLYHNVPPALKPQPPREREHAR